MDDAFRGEIDAMYRFAGTCDRLDTLMPELFALLDRNEAGLAGVNYAYRLTARDTGYTCAFALQNGQLSVLTDSSPVDVTVTGRESHLLAVFQRRMSPAAALALRRIRVEGSMSALLKLAEFL